jgi:hypothetical protein
VQREQAAKPKSYTAPSADEAREDFANIIVALERRSIEARQAIQRYARFIKMTPEPDGYLAEGKWDLRVKWKTPAPLYIEEAGVLGVPADSLLCGNQGSGGRICQP